MIKCFENRYMVKECISSKRKKRKSWLELFCSPGKALARKSYRWEGWRCIWLYIVRYIYWKYLYIVRKRMVKKSGYLDYLQDIFVLWSRSSDVILEVGSDRLKMLIRNRWQLVGGERLAEVVLFLCTFSPRRASSMENGCKTFSKESVDYSETLCALGFATLSLAISRAFL